MGFLIGAAFAVAVVAGARGTWSPCGLSMVSAINPMSERSRGYRYWLTAVWFVLGSLVGSLAIGVAAAVIAFGLSVTSLSGSVLLALAGLGALVTLASDLALGGFRLPSHPRQVNELWLMQYRRWLYASGFGVQIGSGFATYIMTAGNYLVVALAGLTASPQLAFAIALCFGLVRGLAVLLTARCRSTAALQSLHRRLAAWEPTSLRVVEVVEAAVVVSSAFVLGGLAMAFAAGLVVLAVCFGPRWFAVRRLGRRKDSVQFS